MRWVKWSERAPTLADTDYTHYVITKYKDPGGRVVFKCAPYPRTDIQVRYWLEGAKVDLVDTPITQPTTHIRKVEL